MPFDYIPVDDAIKKDGLRMVVVGNVPSPWGEAAKGIFHIQEIEWSAVRLEYDNPALQDWAGELSGPVAVWQKEPPRSGWAEILLLADRLKPENSLIPKDPMDRALMFGLSHEILGPQGLCWSRRLQSIHGGLKGEGGFPQPVAEFLAKKYGHTEEMGKASTGRVVALLNMFADRLKAQKATGTDYYIADRVSALDVYSATGMALFGALPEEVCKMNPKTRETFESMNAETRAALDPVLMAHRDMMYVRHLETPLSL